MKTYDDYKIEKFKLMGKIYGCEKGSQERLNLTNELVRLCNTHLQNLEDYDYAKGAFISEMWNHEYAIDAYEGDYNVLKNFGVTKFVEWWTADDYMNDVEFSPDMKRAFHDARREYINACMEKGLI